MASLQGVYDPINDGPRGIRESPGVAYDLVIEINNEPGALARVAGAISDAGVNLAAATCSEGRGCRA